MRYRVPDLASATWHTAEIEVEKSRFLTWICHAPNTADYHAMLQAAKTAHPNASHHCTAFIAGPPGEQTHIGFSDDGEPGGTAGRPMYQALLGSQMGEIGCVVIRYFGGTKLGTGGLARAYAQSVNAGLKHYLPAKSSNGITTSCVSTLPMKPSRALGVTSRKFPSNRQSTMATAYASRLAGQEMRP